METRAHYVAVGAFVLTMIVLAFATVLWLGRAELTTQYANYDIYFVGPVSGLRVGAAVEYSGVPVGKVSEIQIVGGTQDAPLLLPQAGQRYAVIRSHRSRFASVAARAPQLLEKASDTLDYLNDLLDEKNRRAVSETLENIRTLSAGLGDTNKDIAELAVNANTAVLTASNLLANVDRSYSGPDGLGNRLATAIADFDHVAKDVRPGVRSFTQQTLSDVGD